MEPYDDISIFKALLRAVENQYWKNGNHASSVRIAAWKGQDILLFQDDLREKTGNTISEKWFYTYVKNEPQKLPRIDILNILCKYSKQENWVVFASVEKDRILAYNNSQKESEHLKNDSQQEPKHLKSKNTYIISMVLLSLSCIYWIYSFMNKETDYEFCFVDYYSKTAIENMPLDIQILKENESPLYVKTDQNGCFKGTAQGSMIRFVVSSPYHKTDTITRILKETKAEVLPIYTNDYALMLDYYTNGKVEDVKIRRQQLSDLIKDNAIIMEVLPYSIGVTLYEKEDFINKITTPTKSLSRMEIISTRYENDQIVQLKYRQRDEK